MVAKASLVEGRNQVHSESDYLKTLQEGCDNNKRARIVNNVDSPNVICDLLWSKDSFKATDDVLRVS